MNVLLGARNVNKQLNNQNKLYRKHQFWVIRMTRMDPYTLTTDASLFGIGAIISQGQQWGERVIAYASKTLSKSQRNYCATKRELFAIVILLNTSEIIFWDENF